MIENIFYITWYAVMNRARGSKLYGLTTSTTIGRLISMFGMAISTSLLIGGTYYALIAHTILFWALLMLWAMPAWDWAWELACATPAPISTGWPPVVWLMNLFWKQPPYDLRGDNWKMRIYGTIAMGLRQLMLVPFLFLVAYLSHGNYYLLPIPILFGLWYTIAGLIWPVLPSNPILPAELAVGTSIGLTILTITGAI